MMFRNGLESIPISQRKVRRWNVAPALKAAATKEPSRCNHKYPSSAHGQDLLISIRAIVKMGSSLWLIFPLRAPNTAFAGAASIHPRCTELLELDRKTLERLRRDVINNNLDAVEGAEIAAQLANDPAVKDREQSIKKPV
jgi:hypothetical protein